MSPCFDSNVRVLKSITKIEPLPISSLVKGILIDHNLDVLVLATKYGNDRLFILEWEKLQDIAILGYSAWIDSKDGVRPRKHKSLHCFVSPGKLTDFENEWDKITERF